MRICQVELSGFRGIRHGRIILPAHAVLLGANNSGKTTIVESLALLFGRERMVRPVSDWDFYGGAPKPDSRFYPQKCAIRAKLSPQSAPRAHLSALLERDPRRADDKITEP